MPKWKQLGREVREATKGAKKAVEKAVADTQEYVRSGQLKDDAVKAASDVKEFGAKVVAAATAGSKAAKEAFNNADAIEMSPELTVGHEDPTVGDVIATDDNTLI